jgi:hypothetical protein
MNSIVSFKRKIICGLFVLLSVAQLPFSVSAAEFQWPKHGTIGFEVPAGWRIKGQQAEDVGFAFSARPTNGANAVAEITLANVPGGATIDKQAIKKRLEDSLQPYLEGSTEKKFQPVELKMRQGCGWYDQLTDASLVGKLPVKDDHKVMRNALVALDDHTLVVITMFFDNPKGNEPNDMLSIVQSMEFKRVN